LVGLNLEFIQNASRITSFNFTIQNFQSLDYKREIRYLFGKNFFPDFDLSKTISNVRKDCVNNLISELKSLDFHLFDKMHTYNLNGIGPGEITLFFLVDDVFIKGGTSAGVDIVSNDVKYEVKAAKISRDNVAYDFKLGGTFSLGSIIYELDQLRKNCGLPGSEASIPGNVISEMRLNYSDEFKPIELNYAKLAYKNYFKSHDVIFMNHNTCKASYGRIEAIKRVKSKDIKIERVTSGTIKPKVKL